MLGPYGSCKSLLAQQLAFAAGSEFRAAWEAADRSEPLPIAYLVSYEDLVSEIRRRMLANIANIPFRRLNAFTEEGDMSTSDHLLDYERELYRAELAAGVEVPGERERIQTASSGSTRSCGSWTCRARRTPAAVPGSTTNWYGCCTLCQRSRCRTARLHVLAWSSLTTSMLRFAGTWRTPERGWTTCGIS